MVFTAKTKEIQAEDLIKCAYRILKKRGVTRPIPNFTTIPGFWKTLSFSIMRVFDNRTLTSIRRVWASQNCLQRLNLLIINQTPEGLDKQNKNAPKLIENKSDNDLIIKTQNKDNEEEHHDNFADLTASNSPTFSKILNCSPKPGNNNTPDSKDYKHNKIAVPDFKTLDSGDNFSETSVASETSDSSINSVTDGENGNNVSSNDSSLLLGESESNNDTDNDKKTPHKDKEKIKINFKSSEVEKGIFYMPTKVWRTMFDCNTDIIRRLYPCLISKYFKTFDPYCILAFKTPRRNQKVFPFTPYVIFYAYCTHNKTGNRCRTFIIKVMDPPKDSDEMVPFHVTAFFTRSHKNLRAKQVRNIDRTEVMKKMEKTSCNEYRRQTILDAEENIVLSGNAEKIVSKCTLWKIKEELNCANDFDKHDFIDLVKMKEFEDAPDEVTYLREICKPLRVIAHSQAQMSITSTVTKITKVLIANLDATGKVVRVANKKYQARKKNTGKEKLRKTKKSTKFKNKKNKRNRGRDTEFKRVLYYALTINVNNTILPISELLSSRHAVHNIAYWLSYVKYSLLLTSANMNSLKIIVTDFCLMLIIAVLYAFNRMTLKVYLDVLYVIITESKPMKMLVHVQICAPHFIKVIIKDVKAIVFNKHAVIPQINEVTKNKEHRNTNDKGLTEKELKRIRFWLVRNFACLIICTSYTNFKIIFRAICYILLLKKKNEKYQEYKSVIHNVTVPDDFKNEIETNDEDEKTTSFSDGKFDINEVYVNSILSEKSKIIKNESKFYKDLKEIKDTVQEDCNEMNYKGSDVDNEFLPFSNILDIFINKCGPFVPLWSAILLPKLGIDCNRFSNSSIEAHMGFSKNDYQDKVVNQKPGRFLQKQKKCILAMCKEIYLDVPKVFNPRCTVEKRKGHSFYLDDRKYMGLEILNLGQKVRKFNKELVKQGNLLDETEDNPNNEIDAFFDTTGVIENCEVDCKLVDTLDMDSELHTESWDKTRPPFNFHSDTFSTSKVTTSSFMQKSNVKPKTLSSEKVKSAKRSIKFVDSHEQSSLTRDEVSDKNKHSFTTVEQNSTKISNVLKPLQHNMTESSNTVKASSEKTIIKTIMVDNIDNSLKHIQNTTAAARNTTVNATVKIMVDLTDDQEPPKPSNIRPKRKTSYEVGPYLIDENDLTDLKSNNNFLADSVVMAMLHISALRAEQRSYNVFCFDTHMLDVMFKFDGAKFRRYVRQQKVTNYAVWIFPINITNTHWFLIVVSLSLKTIICLDSLQNYESYGKLYMPKVFKFVKTCFAEFKKTEICVKNWSFVLPTDTSTQQGNQCAVFCSLWSLLIATGDIKFMSNNFANTQGRKFVLDQIINFKDSTASQFLAQKSYRFSMSPPDMDKVYHKSLPDIKYVTKVPRFENVNTEIFLSKLSEHSTDATKARCSLKDKCVRPTGKMILCEGYCVSRWYHQQCIGMKLTKIPEIFICRLCEERNFNDCQTLISEESGSN